MKKYKFIIIIILALFSSACEKELLEKSPNDQVDMKGFYKDASTAEMGLIGAYARTLSFAHMDWWLYESIAADELTGAQHTPQLNFGTGEYRNLMKGTEWGVHNVFYSTYRAIASLNLLLANVQDIEPKSFMGNRKNEIMGEAYFLRAFNYFQLTFMYRDIPIVLDFPTSTKPEDNYVSKSTQDEILALVIADLNKSIELLPERLPNMEDQDVKGRASKWVAKAYLAKVYMWQNKYTEAFQLANEIINSGQFIFEERWTNLFAFKDEWQGPPWSISPENENNSKEVIFQAQNQAQKNGKFEMIGYYRWYCDAFENSPLPPYAVTTTMRDYFEHPNKDVRWEYSVRAEKTTPGFGGRNVKFFHVPSGLDLPDSWESRDKNVPILRLTEILFIKAECIIQSGYSLGSKEEVLGILNKIRARSADPLYLPREGKAPAGYKGCEGIAQLTIDQVDMKALKDEKTREMMFENVRWIDLLRWSRNEDNWQTVMAICRADNPDQCWAALPVSELDRNPKLIQNPGFK